MAAFWDLPASERVTVSLLVTVKAAGHAVVVRMLAEVVATPRTTFSEETRVTVAVT
jgi:hypothetical protein